ncbi:mucin-5AC isoform X2 [Strongylocentrotus purpuratus]|uniref:Uncharacterized protein n=1 Tax=Strongylocentrotus purpuratus TaxID=7668 RepID=A0A7M7PHN2_STRPU|nr:mucin-5AC isoform X2 [Strongylocentrotus purpuratus]
MTTRLQRNYLPRSQSMKTRRPPPVLEAVARSESRGCLKADRCGGHRMRFRPRMVREPKLSQDKLIELWNWGRLREGFSSNMWAWVEHLLRVHHLHCKGIDNMEEFDLHPQTPTSAQAQPDLFATPGSPDPFVLAGPPAAAPPAAAAFGASDPFKVQATHSPAVNGAAPPPAATSTPSNDLFAEFKDTFTAPPAQQAVHAFAGMSMGQTAPNPFGGMQTAPAPFQANFGGMGGMPAAFGGAPAAYGGAPAAFGGAPGAYGAPARFGAPPAAQQPADPFGGNDMFGDIVLKPEATAAAALLNNTQPAGSDPFSGLGALGSSSKADAPKSTKDMFANYKIGKPGEAQPAPEIKLTGGPKRPPPAIPTSPQSSTCPAVLPPSSLKLIKPHSQEKGNFDMPSPQGPPPPLPPDAIDIKKQDKPEVPINAPFAPKPEPNKDHDLTLPSPTNSPPPLPNYMNINDIHASFPLPEINFDSNSPPPPPPPRSRPGQLRLSNSNPLPVPPRNRTRSSQSSPPHSPHSETASIKSCDARFFSAPSPDPNRVSSPSIVSTCSALSTLDETQGEDSSSGITSNSAPSHSNSMNSLSSVFDSNNVSTDTFDNESNTASPSPSPIAPSLCHDNSTTRAIDIIPSHFTLSASQPKRPCSTSQDSLYSSVETLSPSSTQSMHPSFTSNQNSSHDTFTSSSRFMSSSTTVFSTSAPVIHDSLMVGKSRSHHSLSPLTLPQLPVHDDPFADDPFSRHSPSVKKTFVLNSFADFSSSVSTTTDTKSLSQNSEKVWTSHTITNMNNDLPSDVVVNSDPFGGAPVTNGNSGSSNLFGNQFDTFDFSTN